MKKIVISALLGAASIAAHAGIIGVLQTRPAGQQLYSDNTCGKAADDQPGLSFAAFLRDHSDEYVVGQTDSDGKTTILGCYHRTGAAAIVTWQDGNIQVKTGVNWLQ